MLGENYKNSVDQNQGKYQLKYFDMENTRLSDQESNFYDITHLNKNGAKLFSEQLADSLKEM